MTVATPVLRCPKLIGRTREFDALASAIERARRGDGNAVLVTGPAGVGKSRLVAEAISSARAAGCMVLSGQCSRLRVESSLGPLIEVFLPATRRLDKPTEDSLAPFAAVLGRVVPHWMAPEHADTGDSSAFAIGEGVCRLLGALGVESTVVLVVEDLHWSDNDSLQVLAYVARHLSGQRAAVILTSRDREPDASPGLADLLNGGAEHVALGPLDADAVASMAAACLQLTEAPTETVTRLQAITGGLPLLVEDLVGAEPGQGPQRFAEVVESRIATLQDSARRVIEVAAFAGDAIDAEVICAAGSFDRPTVTAALHQGAARQLLTGESGGMRFRHALTAQIIRDSLPPDERRALSGQVAGALEANESPQLAAAGDLWQLAGNFSAASRCHLAATRATVSAGSLTIAEQLYRSALEHTDPTDAELRRGIMRELLDVLVAAGNFDQVLRDGGGALDGVLPSSSDATRIHLLLAQAHLHQGDADAARRQLETAQHNRNTDPGVLARIRLTEAQLALGGEHDERLDASRHLAAQAVGIAESASDHALTCQALELMALCERHRSLSDSLAPLERILALAEHHHLELWKLRALNEIGAIEVLRDASGERLTRARQLARDLGAPGTLASIEVNLSALHLMCGRTNDARIAATACRDLAEPLGLVPLTAAATMLEGVSRGYEGDTSGMDQDLRAAEKLAPDDPDMLALAWAAGRGITALLREDRADARRAFEHADRYNAPARTLNPARGPLLLLRAVDGEPVSDDIAAAAGAGSPDARYPHMWLCFARADTLGANRRASAAGGATAAFNEAESLAHPYRLFRAVALRLVAEAALRDGWGQPPEWLRDAETEFVARSLPRITSACRALLKQAGEPTTRRRGADSGLAPDLLAIGVTAREAEVLELVAQRLTNKEIAERLYLSPRTVEKHVANLLTKTTCDSRADLAFYAQHR